jgi:leader peptidase (prepilin peptidase) / N-methyltransferase
MINIFAILVFILGTVIGSFLSVVIYRLRNNKKGMFLDRSICPSCDDKIRWYHLIPVFSWMFLKGKCAYCGKKISIHYFALEVLTGLLFVGLFLHFNFLMDISSIVDSKAILYDVDWKIFSVFIYHIILGGFLMAIFFYDLLYKEIPDHFSVPAIFIAIIGGLTFGTPSYLSMIIGGVGLLLFFLLQFLISKGAWVGGGDLRLGLFMGIFLGWELGLVAIVLSYMMGAVVSVYLMARGKANRKTELAFGPFMVIGIFISLFYGQKILDWYLNGFLI